MCVGDSRVQQKLALGCRETSQFTGGRRAIVLLEERSRAIHATTVIKALRRENIYIHVLLINCGTLGINYP